MKYCVVCQSEKFFSQLQAYFSKKSTEIKVLNSYNEILNTAENESFYEYDLFIFSISDQNKSGIEVLEYFDLINLRTPVIFIGDGNKIDLMSLVFGRNAEDYIHFPFELKELELRISKAIRKTVVHDDSYLTPEHTYTYSNRSVSSLGYYMDLTEMQRRILYLFITHKNRIVTFSMIQDYVYNGKEHSSNALATHIRDIRKKIKDIKIKSVKGIGYILQTEEK